MVIARNEWSEEWTSFTHKGTSFLKQNLNILLFLHHPFQLCGLTWMRGVELTGLLMRKGKRKSYRHRISQIPMKRACNAFRHQLVARMWSELNMQTEGLTSLTTLCTTNNLGVNNPMPQLWTLFCWRSPSLSPTSPLRDRGGAPKNPLTKPTFKRLTSQWLILWGWLKQTILTVTVKCTDFLWALITMSRLERFQTELPLLREWHWRSENFPT